MYNFQAGKGLNEFDNTGHFQIKNICKKHVKKNIKPKGKGNKIIG